jgi:hypothetical protein
MIVYGLLFVCGVDVQSLNTECLKHNKIVCFAVNPF